MLPVEVNVLVEGLYISALARQICWVPDAMKTYSSPPTINTCPLFRSVAVKFARPVFKLPVAANVPVPGLYRIALGRPYCSRFLPPAARTCPLFSTVAVKKARWAPILPVTVQVCACTFRLAARNSRNKPSHPGSLVLFINLSFPGVVRNLAFDDLDEQGNFAEQVGGARCSRTSITRNDTRVCLRAIKKL